MIFLDNASTTKALPECIDIATKYLLMDYYNPSALYHNSLVVSKEIKAAKDKILSLIHGNGQIIFTASGTESDNLALFGTKKANNSRIIISASEHPAIYNSAMELKQRGYDVVETNVDSTGRVILSDFEKIMTANTSLVSIMHVNNESGCINDIKELCKIAKRINPDVIFHSDGVQAVGKIKTSMQELGVDLYSISGHKFHAPKGVGALFVKNGINLRPIIFGGGQENGIRSATENVAGIMSFAFALEKALSALNDNFEYVKNLKNIILENLDENNFHIISDNDSSPYVLNLALKYVRGEVMLHSLEKYDIYIGTGSACSSKKTSKRIPQLFQLTPEYEKGIIRVSCNEYTTKSDIEYFINKLNLEYSTLIKYVRG
jgi:cysteine desulfurase